MLIGRVFPIWIFFPQSGLFHPMAFLHMDLFSPQSGLFHPMAFLHDPVEVLGTRGHMVRPRRGPLQFNLRANYAEFKNSRRQVWCQLSSKAAIAGRGEAADKISRQDHGPHYCRIVMEMELRNPTAQERRHQGTSKAGTTRAPVGC
jgi:hypothetical protein